MTLGPLPAAAAADGATFRLSLATLTGIQADGPSGGHEDAELRPSLSTDGLHAVFTSLAGNLAGIPDLNAAQDVFVRDLAGGTTEIVSIDSLSRAANGDSQLGSISGDATIVAFESKATNLDIGDTNRSSDIFVRDLTAKETRRISLTTAGEQRDGDSQAPSISADGRYVAFQSDAPLVSGDTNGVRDIYLRDLETATTSRISVGAAGQADGPSSRPSISGDGRRVAFESAASNLAGPDANGATDIFLRDLSSNTTSRLSLDASRGDPNRSSSGPAISGDGKHVAFTSLASDLVASPDTNTCGALIEPGQCPDVFVRDVERQSTRRVSLGPGGAQTDGPSNFPMLSRDGGLVAFASEATNLVEADSNDLSDVFVHNLNDGHTARASIASARPDLPPPAEADGTSYAPAISPDGSIVAYASTATNLVPDDTNGFGDVFGHRIGASCANGATESGPASGPVHNDIEPLAGPVGQQVHDANCVAAAGLGL